MSLSRLNSWLFGNKKGIINGLYGEKIKLFNQMKIKKIIKILILIIIAILTFCFIMKNLFPAEWSFITPHKQGDFVRVGNLHSHNSTPQLILLNDGRVFIMDADSRPEVYSPTTRKFHLLKLGNIKLYHNASILDLRDGRVLIFGGFVENNTPNTFIFNSNTNSFTTGPNIPINRENYAYALLNDGRLFLVGGQLSDDLKTEFDAKTTKFYNFKTGSFEKGPELPVEMPYMSKIVQLENDDIYVFGCTYIDEYNCEERIYKLANGSNSFEYIDKLFCHNDTIHKLKTGEIITFCGVGANKTDVNKIIILDSMTDKLFFYSLNLPQKYSANTVLLPNGSLLFAGSNTGFNISYRAYKDVRMYDFKHNKLKLLDNQLKVKRSAYASAILLKDGNILIIGGERWQPKPFSAEIYMFNNKIEQ